MTFEYKANYPLSIYGNHDKIQFSILYFRLAMLHCQVLIH